MKTSRALVIFLGLGFFIFFASQPARAILSFKSDKVNYSLEPYEQHPADPSAKILFLGDSTGVGTGAESNRQSVAGYFGQDFPKAEIVNNSLNGRKTGELLSALNGELSREYDLAVIQLGANDILRLRTVTNTRENLQKILAAVRPKADHVILLHSGNIGLAPGFFWPLTTIYQQRSQTFRKMYMELSAKYQNVHYIDLYQNKKDDIFLKDVDHYYSADKIHPAGPGYRYWYDKIRETMRRENIQLN